MISENFNPRSPHGERLQPCNGVVFRQKIFQPTLPARGATKFFPYLLHQSLISTHAPRTGSDRPMRACIHAQTSYFNPRSPHGERRHLLFHFPQELLFQPTLPARGATRPFRTVWPRWSFQPTLPARGATMASFSSSLTHTHFNPRSPHGERHGRKLLCIGFVEFQPTLPARGATRCNHYAGNVGKYFNPRSPHGERHCQ